MPESAQWTLYIIGCAALIYLTGYALSRWICGERGEAVLLLLGGAVTSGLLSFPQYAVSAVRTLARILPGPTGASSSDGPAHEEPADGSGPAAIDIPWSTIGTGAAIALTLAATFAVLHLFHRHCQRRTKDHRRRT